MAQFYGRRAADHNLSAMTGRLRSMLRLRPPYACGHTHAWNVALAAMLLCRPLAAHGQQAPTVGIRPSVTVGADRLFGEFAHLVRGRSVALVSNHSGRLANGVHLADTLAAHPDVRLVALFGMEYDIRSNDYSVARDPERTTDRRTGVPKYSLYGEQHKPSPEMLDGVEVLVYDIQDVGARFYEHVNILGFIMEAAAERGITVVVLDRPNPLGGRGADGFVADSQAFYRFGSYTAIPALHGMTPGELAQLYNGERMLRGGRQAALHVVPLQGWTRDQWFDQTGLPWHKPSPNLLTLASLTAYAGTCLFEAVNLSAGRGSDSPFELIGAPWLDHHEAVRLLNGLALAGVRFVADTFTPRQREFHARPPMYAGEPLRAIRVEITDRTRVHPYRVGVAMLWAVHTLHRRQLVWNDATLDRLSATPRLKQMLEAGRTPQEIFASWDAELGRFNAQSMPYRLYP
jgi:uncharacterized protein YbbC (DUF1343 family)